MFKEVYQQDKRDDINMKLQEHEAIVNSEEERARLSQQGKLEKTRLIDRTPDTWVLGNIGSKF